MASGLHRLVTALREHNHALVHGFCEFFRQVGARDGGLWHTEQACLWILLTDTEARIRQLKLRRKKRNHLWKVSRIAKSASPELRQAHQEALTLQMRQLELRVSIIKQIGDTFAWAVALNDPRFIAPLYKEATHQLPDDHSVDGLMAVLHEAAASGEYLAVLADITRCCGTGDLLIRGTRWPCPSPFEAKVKKHANGELSVFLYGSSIAFHVYPDELGIFTKSLGVGMPGRVSFDERGEVQKQEVDKRTRKSEENFMTLANFTSPSIKRHWSIMGNVVERAMCGVVACEPAEHGIVYVAVPSSQSNDKEAMAEVRQVLSSRGVNDLSKVWDVHTTCEVIADDSLSALIPPFLTWQLPPHQLTALMAGELILGCAVHQSVWERAFLRVGLSWKEQEGAWLLTGAGREISFDPTDVQRLKNAVAYSGASPEYTAAIAATQLYMPGFISVDRYGRRGAE